MNTETFAALYNRYILRDFLGKIIPGAIAIAALYMGARGLVEAKALVTTLPLGGWIAAIGASWVAGFAVQSLGEFFHLIAYYPKPYIFPCGRPQRIWGNIRDEISLANNAQEIRTQLKDVVFGSEDQWNDFWFGVQRASDERGREIVERTVIIKEACGNSGISLLLAFCVFVVVQWPTLYFNKMATWLDILSLGLPALLLIRMHRVHVREQRDRTVQIISSNGWKQDT